MQEVLCLSEETLSTAAESQLLLLTKVAALVKALGEISEGPDEAEGPPPLARLSRKIDVSRRRLQKVNDTLKAVQQRIRRLEALGSDE